MSSGRMLKLTLAHCGQPIFVNPLLIAGVCTPTPLDDDDLPVPEDHVHPGAFVYMAGNVDSYDVKEPAEQVAEMWQEIMNA
ncbi:hypothetical protein P9A47_gp82 [Xanthomonas phage Elanor]|uniref:Uncharacterized protein n=1 Tax=Xanthomonas phage Elanor TaxID=2939127 RepID=A0A9E7E3D8_9CAUD|nr:hypothetical protein P9A47_gp82 [Xanthomonas phage Elanor]URA07050.1 hypothetical protein Elanor_BL40082 [Xanthomonas phage Elanor]